jgi:hypothetical protein
LPKFTPHILPLHRFSFLPDSQPKFLQLPQNKNRTAIVNTNKHPKKTERSTSQPFPKTLGNTPLHKAVEIAPAIVSTIPIRKYNFSTSSLFPICPVLKLRRLSGSGTESVYTVNARM